MKKSGRKIAIVMSVVLIMALLLSGCGSSSAKRATADMAAPAAPMEMKAEEYGYGDYYNGVEGEMYAEDSIAPAPAPESALGGEAPATDINANTGRKLIKNVNMTMETLTFDDTIAMIERKAAELGGYVESSNIRNGSQFDYYYSASSSSYRRLRGANYTVRIPALKLDNFTDAMGDMGNVTSKNLTTNDVTLSYVDTESRVKALRIQQDRLLALLSEADEIESIIELEKRLSDVNYELERNESVIRNYDNLVAFSTVYLDITEVERITHEPTAPKTVGERISEGLSDTFYDIGEGFKNFTVNFVVNLPRILIALVIIALIVFIIIRIIIAIKRRVYRANGGLKERKPKKERRPKKERKPLFGKKNEEVLKADEEPDEGGNDETEKLDR